MIDWIAPGLLPMTTGSMGHRNTVASIGQSGEAAPEKKCRNRMNACTVLVLKDKFESDGWNETTLSTGC